MIKAVIFDFDDTLIYTQRICIKNYISAAKNLNMRVPTEREVVRLFGLPWPKIVEILWPEADLETFNEAYVQCRGKEEYEAVKNAGETIKKLKQSFTLGILTSRRGSSIYRVMKETGYDKEDFKFIDTHNDGKISKPDPKVFNHFKNILDTEGIIAEETVYVGDAIFDYQAARDAGLHFIAFINGAYTGEEFIEEGLDKNLVMKSFKELPGILAKNFKMEKVA